MCVCVFLDDMSMYRLFEIEVLTHDSWQWFLWSWRGLTNHVSSGCISLAVWDKRSWEGVLVPIFKEKWKDNAKSLGKNAMHD